MTSFFLVVFSLVLFFHLEAFEKKTVCLNMIVKNESHVIRRCLDSVKPIIDYWVIVDTGSSDGTQQIIKSYLKDIPGELHERPWKNFAHNRNEALEYTKGKADYILFMDADDWLEFDNLPSLPSLTCERYNIWRVVGEDSFLNHQLVLASLPWKWVGVVHEHLECGKKPTMETLEHVVYRVGNDGASHNDPSKFQKYISLLEEALKQEPDNSRYVFYLAQSYLGAGNFEKAVEFYTKRLYMGIWTEETFWALLNLGQLYQLLHHPIEKAIHAYSLALSFLPYRSEPVYFLAELYNRQGNYQAAYHYLKHWETIPKTKKKDYFYNYDWTCEYGLLFQLSVAAYYVGKYEESLTACTQLLEIKNLPPSWRKQTEINRTFVLHKLGIKTKISSDITKRTENYSRRYAYDDTYKKQVSLARTTHFVSLGTRRIERANEKKIYSFHCRHFQQ